MKAKKLKRFCFFSVIFYFICVTFHAQGKITAPSPTNLKMVISEMMRDWKTPGLGIALVKDGKVLLAEGFGLRNIERNLKVTPHTLFPIVSCTKTFTAVSIAALVDEGKLKWDIPVKEYVPAINFSDDYAESHITIRDLLAHRSGFPQHYLMYFNRQLSREEIMERLRLLEPNRGYRWEIDLGATTILIKKGNRIRLEILSSNFPKYDRNPNTGENTLTVTDFKKVKQTVFHSPQHPSHLVLPVRISWSDERKLLPASIQCDVIGGDFCGFD